MTLNEEVAKIEAQKDKAEKIPAKVAISDAIPDYKDEYVVFAFKEYKQSHCEIYKLEKKEVKKLTEELSKVNKTRKKHLLSQGVSRIACKSVYPTGKYKFLSGSLPTDAQILEISYTGAGRIFGYLTENIFNIVTIKKSHLK